MAVSNTPHVWAARSLIPVGWTGRGREQFTSTPAIPLERLKKWLRPGAILLVHESATHPAERLALLGGLLDHLSAEGYRCILPAPDQLQ